MIVPVGSYRGCFLAAALLIGLAACGTTADQNETSEQRLYLRLSETLGHKRGLSAAQIIDADYADMSLSFHALLEISADQVQLVLLLPAGPRLATIYWTLDGVRTEGILRNSRFDAVDANDILQDIILVYWPLSFIDSHLKPGYRIVERGAQRNLLDVDGNVLVAIERSPGDPWAGMSRLQNKVLGYRLTISSRIVEAA